MEARSFEQPIRLVSKRTKIKTLAKEFIVEKDPDEAFFLCDLGEIVRKHQEWITFLPRVKPFYAVKCNDDENVLKILAELGTGFDCASKVEIAKVINLGVHESRIIFANPAKQESHIRAAAQFNVDTMTFDNVNELRKIKVFHPNARLVIRIRCDAQKAQCQLGMKFGVLVSEAPELLKSAHEMGLDVIGVSFHVGSGCMEDMVYHRAISSAKWLFGIAYDIGFNFTLLDIGGGFPGNIGTTIEHISRVVNASLDEYFPVGCGVDIIGEPGRFYVASSFSLLTQVHSVREVSSEEGAKQLMYFINDGVYGSFNCVLYDHAIVQPQTLNSSSDESEREHFRSSIWGPTCDGLDQVCSNAFLPLLEIGDWLLFDDMGAYTMVAAGTFNGFPVSKVNYFIREETWDVIDKLIVERRPVFLKSGVGYNRDKVGWGMALATVSHPTFLAGEEKSYEDMSSSSSDELYTPSDSTHIPNY